MKTTITQKEYIMLQGLIAVAEKHNAICDSCVKSIADILGEDDDAGHSSDVAYGSRGLDELLRVLGIKVEPTAP